VVYISVSVSVSVSISISVQNKRSCILWSSCRLVGLVYISVSASLAVSISTLLIDVFVCAWDAYACVRCVRVCVGSVGTGAYSTFVCVLYLFVV